MKFDRFLVIVSATLLLLGALLVGRLGNDFSTVWLMNPWAEETRMEERIRNIQGKIREIAVVQQDVERFRADLRKFSGEYRQEYLKLRSSPELRRLGIRVPPWKDGSGGRAPTGQ